MTQRKNVPANSPWATQLSYSRAVAIDGHVFVSGTLPVDSEGNLVGGDDPYLQTKQVLKVIAAALVDANVEMADVVRIRIYLRDYEDIAAIAKAQFELFEQIRPACTVQKSELIGKEYRVQMDAEAYRKCLS